MLALCGSLALALPEQRVLALAHDKPAASSSSNSSSSPHRVVGWKLKKVGGTTLSMILEGFAEANGLSYQFRLEEPTSHDPDVVCSHGAVLHQWPVLHDPDAMHILLTRDPKEQAVSLYYYSESEDASVKGGLDPGHKCGTTSTPTAAEVATFMKFFTDDFDKILPKSRQEKFMRLPKSGAMQNVVDLDFNDYEASAALLSERLGFALPETPHEKNCPHPRLDDWTEDAKAEVERVLNSTRIPALVAASQARYRQACAQSEGCSAVLARRASYSFAAGAAPRALQSWPEE